MPNPSEPLSRRAVLESAGIAPLILIGNRVMAGEMTHEAVGILGAGC